MGYCRSDPFNSANQQNCSYGYDGMTRVSSVGCGNVWQRTFSYDPFGNITKTGSSSRTPTYTNSKNQYLSGWNGVTYDNDGSLTYDTFHHYQWDASGHPTVIDGSSNQAYDALGNLVEASQPGFVVQYLYDENGYEFGVAQAQSNAVVNIALPGGGRAHYLYGTLTNYGHFDWLGSSRLTSGASQGFTGDEARAPFGEEYAIQGSTVMQYFAGIERNLEPDLYDTHYREYHTTQGRWLTPDPSGLAAVDPSNPQTWNRYAYVANNPLSNTDPLGLYCFINCDGGGPPGGIGASCDVTGRVLLPDPDPARGCRRR
jgi:RHS repeat-associated protein